MQLLVYLVETTTTYIVAMGGVKPVALLAYALFYASESL